MIVNEKQASLTVEASFVLPIFLFAMMLISYIGQLIACQDEVQQVLTRIAREASAEYGTTKNSIFTNQLYYKAKFVSYMKGEGLLVSFSESTLLEKNDEIDLVVTYTMKTPFSSIFHDSIRMRQRVHTRAFTGVEKRGYANEQANKTVYITPTGRVYHEDLECTYLKLSISKIFFSDLERKRNESGGKYKECEKCGRGNDISATSPIWITNYGDRYHRTKSCSGLKRTIQKMDLSQVGNRTACSKCGGD